VEALVGGYEGGFGPICFLQTTPCGPVISIPQTVVYLHWLVKWELHSQVIAVLEYPYWVVIHIETAHPTFGFLLVIIMLCRQISIKIIRIVNDQI